MKRLDDGSGTQSCQKTSRQVDVFGVGAVMYFAIDGQMVFRGSSLTQAPLLCTLLSRLREWNLGLRRSALGN